MKKYKVWVHVDTGYSVEVEADGPAQAEVEARTNAPLTEVEYLRQLSENAQIGEATVTN